VSGDIRAAEAIIVFKRIIPVMAVILLLIGLAIVPAVALLPVGQEAPDFQLSDLSGNVHKLSGYRGKVVVIDFFEPYCGYCQEDAKNNLIPLYDNNYKNNPNVQFLSVERSGADAATIQSVYLSATGSIPWPVLTNGSNVASLYGIDTVPTVYVIDSAGKIAFAMSYPIDASALKSKIDQLLSGGWGAWSPVGGQLASGTSPATCAQDAKSLDVFVQGTDSALWYKHSDGSNWSAWQSLGGALSASPAAVSQSTGKIDVAVRGTDSALWSKSTTNGGSSWSGWSKIGGQLLAGTGPAAYAWGDTRIGWMVTGTDNQLWHMWTDSSGTHSWQSLGGVLTSSPSATSSASGAIDVFVRGTDNALWQRGYSNNAWGSWASPGGQLASGTGPAACSWGAGRLDVFVQGTDTVLWHKSYNGAWSGWEPLGGSLTSSPAAASASGSSRIDVFVRGTDNTVWEKSYLTVL
jgi:thiol-disulfide isomerase/thioredoxin